MFEIILKKGSVGWRLLDRTRHALRRACPEGTTRGSILRLLRETVDIWVLEGTGSLLSRPAVRLREVRKGRRRFRDFLTIADPERPVPGDLDAQYQDWLSRRVITPAGEARIRADISGFAYAPLISVIMNASEVSDTRQPRALDAVQAQLYDRWQLCVVYDPLQPPHWRHHLEARAAADPRIRLIPQPGGGGSAEAHNTAVALADGEFITLLRPQDAIARHALYEVVKRLNQNPSVDVIYSDEDALDERGVRRAPFFKPDWSPDLLLSADYACRLCVLRRSTVTAAGGFRRGFDGYEQYDLVLRITERTSRIAHIPDVLYSRGAPLSPAPDAPTASLKPPHAAIEILRQALERRGTLGEVRTVLPERYARRLHILTFPRVSIIIPTRNRAARLWMCIESIKRVTAYPDVEFVLVDNGTTEPRALAYLRGLARDHTVVRDPAEFNHSRLCNRGAREATGQLLLFLNNDIEAMRPDWLTALVEQAVRPDVGAVGCRLVFPDGRIQHAGVVVGLHGAAGHPFHGQAPTTPGYMGLDRIIRNCSAITGSCLMMRRELFQGIGGFDERYRVILGDVDLCLRLRERGYLVVYTPEATMIHHESATRGGWNPAEDIDLFQARWSHLLQRGDPYYHPELSLAGIGYALRTEVDEEPAPPGRREAV